MSGMTGGSCLTAAGRGFATVAVGSTGRGAVDRTFAGAGLGKLPIAI